MSTISLEIPEEILISLKETPENLSKELNILGRYQVSPPRSVKVFFSFLMPLAKNIIYWSDEPAECGIEYLSYGFSNDKPPGPKYGLG
ncbi:hypothetical protein [Gloeocapsa sp. PCC 73106]|uniref:hypothetical protein n=1 Tax=Gloeocapsa sp. PCC 73106 TaxID=102232 RepID=UPI0002ACD781|nr:hypothetical protein [Gloeocapsa sp. PCC 73106]ELR96638.1 hypothetical protein GLO73106DRAFT_00004340 [Gloeocapsa sp. PCC 73106]